MFLDLTVCSSNKTKKKKTREEKNLLGKEKVVDVVVDVGEQKDMKSVPRTQ